MYFKERFGKQKSIINALSFHSHSILTLASIFPIEVFSDCCCEGADSWGWPRSGRMPRCGHWRCCCGTGRDGGGTRDERTGDHDHQNHYHHYHQYYYHLVVQEVAEVIVGQGETLEVGGTKETVLRYTEIRNLYIFVIKFSMYRFLLLLIVLVLNLFLILRTLVQ